MNRKRLLFVLLVLIVLITSILIFKSELVDTVVEFANWAFPEDENRNGEMTKLLLSILGGIAILAGLYIAYLRANASLKAVRNQTDQLILSRESQTNEVFKNAIEHLGSEKESVVLGGISELHFIARDNPKKFREIVSNILCNKIRSESKERDSDQVNYTVIQTIINYIFGTDIYKGLKFNLNQTNLILISFENYTIENCAFSSSELPHFMKNVTFRNCEFALAIANGARYSDVTFENCYLLESEFIESELFNVSMNSVDSSPMINFYNCLLSGGQISADSLSHCDFISCEIDDFNFNSKSIKDSHFIATGFNNIHFKNTIITQNRFISCGFEKSSVNGIIGYCEFRGISNDSKWRIGQFELQFKRSANTENNLDGLKILNKSFEINDKMYNNRFGITYEAEIEGFRNQYPKAIERDEDDEFEF